MKMARNMARVASGNTSAELLMRAVWIKLAPNVKEATNEACI